MSKREKILFICQDANNGGAQQVFRDIADTLEPEFDSTFLFLSDWTFGPQVKVKDAITLKAGSNPTKEYLEGLFWQFNHVHGTNFILKFWDDFRVKSKRRDYTTYYSYFGDPRYIKPRKFPCVDWHGHNRLDAAQAHGLQWFPTGSRMPNYMYCERKEAWHAARNRLGYKNSDFVISMMARICEGKNQLLIIDVLDELVNRHGMDRCKVLLAGATVQTCTATGKPQRHIDKIRGKAAACNLLDRVTILDEQEDVFPLIVASDVCLCSSTNEGFSRMVTEYMAMGVPVVADNVLNNGIHVPGKTYVGYSNAQEATEAILQMLGKYPKCYENIRQEAQRVAWYFEASRMAPKYAEFYRNRGRFDFLSDYRATMGGEAQE